MLCLFHNKCKHFHNFAHDKSYYCKYHMVHFRARSQDLLSTFLRRMHSAFGKQRNRRIDALNKRPKVAEFHVSPDD